MTPSAKLHRLPPSWPEGWAPPPEPLQWSSRSETKTILKRMRRQKESCSGYFCIRKTFTEGDFTGYVCAWHGSECGYYVLYEDGDCEHMEESDVLKFYEAYLRWKALR